MSLNNARVERAGARAQHVRLVVSFFPANQRRKAGTLLPRAIRLPSHLTS